MKHDVIIPAGTRCVRVDGGGTTPAWEVDDLSFIHDKSSMLYNDAVRYRIEVEESHLASIAPVDRRAGPAPEDIVRVVDGVERTPETAVREQYKDLIFTLQDAWGHIHGSRNEDLKTRAQAILRECGDYADTPLVISTDLNVRIYRVLVGSKDLILGKASFASQSLRNKLSGVLDVHSLLTLGRKMPKAWFNIAHRTLMDYDYGTGVRWAEMSEIPWKPSTVANGWTTEVRVEFLQDVEHGFPATESQWLNFNVRFDPNANTLSEAFAMDDKGEIWGKPVRNLSEQQVAENLREYLQKPELVDGWITPDAVALKDGSVKYTQYFRTPNGGLLLRSALDPDESESPDGLVRRFEAGERFIPEVMKLPVSTRETLNAAKLDRNLLEARLFEGEWSHLFGPGRAETQCRIVVDVANDKLVSAQAFDGQKWVDLSSAEREDVAESLFDGNDVSASPRDWNLSPIESLPQWAVFRGAPDILQVATAMDRVSWARRSMSTEPCWWNNPDINGVVNDGVRAGYLHRPSTTQVEWSDAGCKALRAAYAKIGRNRAQVESDAESASPSL
ncbi:hypothetical protein Bcep1808_7552 (plasmid) [Burkholderia vietnamiensis G4]|uniref:Uncharacterized protein n=1 Tax=Burkholderia vietnamiensis (strain G4 / LMG 22486) TaxID=269482 RepID=A4JVX4_BURVG|nr:hypothetical protein Bcep1808_7552 [Burkholderia vietnamiensis G4]